MYCNIISLGLNFNFLFIKFYLKNQTVVRDLVNLKKNSPIIFITFPIFFILHIGYDTMTASSL